MKCQYVAPDGMRKACVRNADHDGRHFADAPSRATNGVCPRCGLAAETECMLVPACNVRALRIDLKARGLEDIYTETAVWLLNLGVTVEAHQTYYDTSSGPLGPLTFSNEAWVPAWAAAATASDASIHAQEQVIRRLAADPLAVALVTSHPGSLERLLADAEPEVQL